MYFSTASGNVVDDQTHCATWDLMCQLVGGPDFLYVADCKLARTRIWATSPGVVADSSQSCRARTAKTSSFVSNCANRPTLSVGGNCTT